MLKSNSNGFTLIEVLVVLAISAVVMTAVFMTQMGVNRHSLRAIKDIESSVNLSAVDSMISSDIRECGLNTESAANCTATSNATLLVISNSVNSTYSFQGTDLLFNNDLLLPNVKSVNFQYFHPDGTSDNNSTNVRNIEYIICDSDDKCINSNIKIRNFR